MGYYVKYYKGMKEFEQRFNNLKVAKAFAGYHFSKVTPIVSGVNMPKSILIKDFTN